ncbi:hot-3 [Pristionchus pacificus]|uniref:Hot-3 n=1 Tax=Pristionchus pacificus TaxID=54126 RepID=A0A2A6B7M7_PRIPA|nr:hot-3 [Pristionchus pacificus]|eukprot:PDM61878.1 hot-3 [Pristionchus pacificus]
MSCEMKRRRRETFTTRSPWDQRSFGGGEPSIKSQGAACLLPGCAGAADDRECAERRMRIWLLSWLAALCSATYVKGPYKPNQCYSCMSTYYEQLFNGRVQNIFNEPKNFTRHCDDPAAPHLLEAVACRTICLTITHDLVVFGQRTGQIVTMRGCAISIAKKGIHNHTLAMFDRYDICREMNAADLFRTEYGRGESQRIKVCSCLGDRCNHAPSSSITLLICLLTVLLSGSLI